MTLKGHAISFEGGEGTGKTTVINLLMDMIKAETDVEILKVREPGGSSISEQIREVIMNKKNTEMFGVTEALLLGASRAQLLNEKVLPELKNGKFVIYDRFVDSSYVYQGFARNLGLENIIQLNDFATGKWLPDRTYVFDLDPEIGFQRIATNNRETNRLDLESMEFYKTVRSGYLKLAERFPERIVVINADQTPEKIAEDIFQDMKKKFSA